MKLTMKKRLMLKDAGSQTRYQVMSPAGGIAGVGWDEAAAVENAQRQAVNKRWINLARLGLYRSTEHVEGGLRRWDLVRELPRPKLCTCGLKH